MPDGFGSSNLPLPTIRELSMFKQEDIVKNIDGEAILYLRRWHILKTPWFKVYLHKFFTPDLDRDPHDHPWDSWILMLWGRYREMIYTKTDFGWNIKIHERSGPSLRSMPAKTIHKITKLRTPHIWTLFLSKKKKRDWGFHTPEGWVYWRDYLNDYQVITDGKDTRQVS